MSITHLSTLGRLDDLSIDLISFEYYIDNIARPYKYQYHLYPVALYNLLSSVYRINRKARYFIPE